MFPVTSSRVLLVIGGLTALGTSCALEFTNYPAADTSNEGAGGQNAAGEAEGGAGSGLGGLGGGGGGTGGGGQGGTDWVTTPTLVAITRAGELYRIDDGVASLVGAVGFHDLSSLAADSAGTLFTAESDSGVSARRLLQVDPTTGAGTVVAVMTNPETLNFRALAFSPADVLYGVNAVDDALYTIELDSGEATRVGPTSLANVQAMDFTEAGQLYVWNMDNSFFAHQPGLNSLHPATGDATEENSTIGTQPIASIATLPGDAAFAAVDETRLLSVDRLSGEATVIGPHRMTDPVGLEVIPLPVLRPAGE
jgi:hypothetical protein